MKFNLNLASRRYVNNRALQYGFMAAFCILLLFILWEANSLFVSNNTLSATQQQIVDTSQQFDLLRGGPRKTLNVKERAALELEFSKVSELLALDAFRWTELLDRMEELLPVGVSLKGFRPDYKKRSLNLNGEARSLKEMRLFLDNLLKNKNFEQVYLNQHSRIKVLDYAGKERSAISFSLQLEGVF